MANVNPLRYRGYYYDTETGFYYLQSRYYDPAIGRFINADSYASTGQNFIGYNMFAYCNNNAIFNADPSGTRAALQNTIFSGYGGASVGSGAGGGLLIAVILFLTYAVEKVEEDVRALAKQVYESATTALSSNKEPSNNDKIDWNAGDKNHILKGTGHQHVDGWEKMGIDPNKGNGWQLLLPILKEVVDYADEIIPQILPNASQLLYYYKTYPLEGVQVVVKIWISANGLIQKLSDAIPYVISK